MGTCKICFTTIITPNISSDVVKKLAGGKDLNAILEALCGVQFSKVKDIILCQDCTLKVVQTESFIRKIRNVFSGITANGEECAVDGEIIKEEEKTGNGAASRASGFDCHLCDYKTKLAMRLKRHLEIKHNLTDVKLYKCSLCPQAYSSRGGLSRHNSWFHCNKTRNFSCTHCDKSFFHEKVLVHHLLKHKPDEVNLVKAGNGLPTTDEKDQALNEDQLSFICDLCQFPAKSEKKLKKHKKREHGEGNGESTTILHNASDNEAEQNAVKRARLACDECDFSTTLSKKLSKHMRQHNKTITETNTISTPKQLEKLKKHDKTIAFNNVSKIHSDDQSVTCLICGQKFSDLQQLRAHMGKSHLEADDGDIPANTCTDCGAKFHNAEKYSAHVAGKKCRDFQYECQLAICHRRFENFEKMKKHMAKAHTNDDEIVENNCH